MATLTTVKTLNGAEENVHFGVSYAILKAQANESADVDCFKISAGTSGKLFYNTGTVASPVWVELTAKDFDTGRGVELRIDGLYVNNVRKTASDAKLYWKGTDGSDAFKVQGVDNVDGVYDANDVISDGGASVSINVTPGEGGGGTDPNNAPPVNTLGSTTAETAGAKSAVTFNAANGNLISVDDVDDEYLTTVVSVTSGKLTVAANSGAIVTGNNTASVKIQGTKESINKALDGLKFEGGAGFTGTTLTVTTNDITQNKDIDTIAIAVGETGGDPDNAPPVNTAPDSVTMTDIGSKIVVFEGTLSVDDADNPNLTTILEVGKGTLKVAPNSGALVTGNNTGTVKIQGSIEAINKALDGLTYTGGSEFSTTDTLTITTNDWYQATDVSTVTITAIPPDGTPVAPVHTLKAASAITGEDTALVFNGNKLITVADPDSASLITVVSVGHGTLVVAAGSGASITNDGTDSVTIVGSAAQVNAALNGLTYTPDHDYNGSDTLTIVTTDDTDPEPLSASNSIALNVTPVNDAPVNIVPGFELGVSGANNTLIFSGNLSVNDVDGDTLTALLEVGEGTLKVAPNSGAWVTGNNTGTVKIQGTIEVINKALDGLTYTGGASFSGDTTLTITTNDWLQAKAISTVTITNNPDLATPDAALTTDSGSSGTDGITNSGAITAPTNGGDATTEYRVQKDGGAFSAWNATYAAPATNGTADGAYVVEVRHNGGDKQSATQQISFTLDATPPTTGLSAIAISADTGESASDFITRTEAQTITATLSQALVTGEELYGSLDGGATWVNITNKIQLFNPTALNWTGAMLEEGSSSIQLQVRDKAGNAGPTASQAYTLDKTAPAVTIGSIDISADTGASASDFITKTAAQTITATLSAELLAGEELYGSVNNGTTWVKITGKVSGTSVSWDGATLAGSSSIKFEVRDAAGNAGTAASQTYILDTTAPTTTFGLGPILGDASYDRVSDTLTLKGGAMNSLLTTDQDETTDIKAQLDWSKLIWDVDGANTADVTFTVADIASAKVTDNNTLVILLTLTKANAIESLANFGTNGTKVADKIDIAAGFAVDAAGNAATGDAKADMSLAGAFNQPKVYSYDLSDGATSGVIDTNMGTDTGSDAITFEPAKGDSLLLQGASASQVTVGGGATVGGTGNATITLEDRSVELLDYQAGLNGNSLTGSIKFADGSVLWTNTGATTMLTGWSGDDLLIAGNNGDTLSGLGGNDLIFGGDGDDVINGGDGDDIIMGGKGNDILNGGNGVDTFLYTYAADGEGYDFINDFTVGAGGDVIELIGAPTIDQAWITAHTFAVEDNTTIWLADLTETITLVGVKADTLTVDNFLAS